MWFFYRFWEGLRQYMSQFGELENVMVMKVLWTIPVCNGDEGYFNFWFLCLVYVLCSCQIILLVVNSLIFVRSHNCLSYFTLLAYTNLKSRFFGENSSIQMRTIGWWSPKLLPPSLNRKLIFYMHWFDEQSLTPLLVLILSCINCILEGGFLQLVN